MINKIIGISEYIFAICSLILYTEGILHIIVCDGFSEGEDPMLECDTNVYTGIAILFMLTYIIAFLLLIRSSSSKKSGLITFLFGSFHVVSLVGLATISFLWSELPLITIYRSISLIGTTIFGIYLANRYTLKQQIILLSHTFMLIILISFIFAIIWPKYGIMAGVHLGSWRGIYTHKNKCGSISTLSIFLFSMRLKEIHKNSRAIVHLNSINSSGCRTHISYMNLFQLILTYLLLLFSAISSVVLLLLSGSSSAILVSAILTATILILETSILQSHRKFIFALGLIISVCIFMVIVTPDLEQLFVLMGKSSDFNGRKDLWGILLDKLSKNPMLGFGYQTFWIQYEDVVAIEAGWRAPDAHNGFLDLGLSLGLLGVVLFIVGYWNILMSSFVRFCNSQNTETLYPLILLVYIMSINISESNLLLHNNIFWVLYVMVNYSMLKIPK